MTFRAVLAMSMSGSIEINSATRAMGKPMAGRTIRAAKVAPPPTPATPNELIAIIPSRLNMKVGSKGLMPMVGAIITASMAGYIPAQPFWPMVAPKEADKFAMGLETPRALIWVSTLRGIVAAELRDVNANVSTGQTFW